MPFVHLHLAHLCQKQDSCDCGSWGLSIALDLVLLTYRTLFFFITFSLPPVGPPHCQLYHPLHPTASSRSCFCKHVHPKLVPRRLTRLQPRLYVPFPAHALTQFRAHTSGGPSTRRTSAASVTPPSSPWWTDDLSGVSGVSGVSSGLFYQVA